MIITKAGIRILKTLLASPENTHTIRALSEKAKINYRQAHEEAMKMNKEGIISIQKQGNSSICKINPGADTALCAYIESLRTKDFLKKNNRIQLIAKELEKMPTVFCTAVLFGSHAKGNATAKSDIDLLLVSEKPEETEANAILKSLSYNIHLNAVSEESFNEMKQKTGLNVVNELKNSHIILAGFEDYCRLIAR